MDNVDDHYKVAKNVGAVIIRELKDEDYQEGARAYTCKDLEGHLWSFGTFDPWKPSPAP